MAFDTSAAHCAAALLCGDEIVAEKHEDMAKGQAERLFPLLEEVLANANMVWSDLIAIGVGIGPGNFTGIRISVSAARGLALSLGIPAIGVSSLEARAFGAPRPVWSLIDARRDHFYVQQFAESGTNPPSLIAGAEIDSLPGDRIGPEVATHPAPTIARIASERLRSGETIVRPAPLYIRSADAAPPRDPAPMILP
ncbi:tRNA (adenosine(37)-N6)-threonylcarbamoyltransferase complex dimerization subunit type 1 TsaB [Aliiroseovarius sp. PrR006]|uniref:tRNA (adenosine(37)-N6)-threonylcarbamoyltransferase complex dimerization subunit type 1 TsaB n=1 Tax=Aliiroseovarius sp. PrR006 TaxID=2706883 RepID=UPI001EF3A32E|nr:tRNA (adenosine(37)-N6)-threonylcarbamoyltransferase complex dimerization subunit type 1 TsaB [Aliiroseovarius sp. PrR006]